MSSPRHEEGSDDDDDEKKPAAQPALESAEKDATAEENRNESSEPAESASSKELKTKSIEIISSADRTPQDVLCGRGMPFQSYPGNVIMHELVGEHRDEYMSSKRSQKPLVIKNIIQKLKDSGARFLKPHGEFHSNEDDRWVEVDDQHVYDKISHVMRHRQRAARSETSSLDAAKKNATTALSEIAAPAPTVAAPALPSGTAASAGAASNQALLTGAASAGPLQALAAGGFGGAFAQQPSSTQSLFASLAGAQNQEAILRALLSSGQAPLLSGLGLLGQPSSLPPSLLLGQNILGVQQQQQQQQLLSLLGLQAPQPSLDQSILAHLRQSQLLRGIENQRLLAGAGLQSQAQSSSLLNDLVNEELRRRALQSLVQGHDQEKPSEEGKEEEKK